MQMGYAMSNVTKPHDNSLAELADELKVEVEVLEERLEMISVVPLVSCQVNVGTCKPD
jgi:hypothetical protein